MKTDETGETDPKGDRIPARTEPVRERAVVTAAESGGGTSKIPIRTTVPDELLRHDISDEELDMLGESKKGFFHEFMWATITGGLGAFPAAFHDLKETFFSAPSKEFGGFELFEVVVFFSFAVLAIFSAILVRQESKNAPSSLKDKIRARTRSIERS